MLLAKSLTVLDTPMIQGFYHLQFVFIHLIINKLLIFYAMESGDEPHKLN